MPLKKQHSRTAWENDDSTPVSPSAESARSSKQKNQSDAVSGSRKLFDSRLADDAIDFDGNER